MKNAFGVLSSGAAITLCGGGALCLGLAFLAIGVIALAGAATWRLFTWPGRLIG